MEKYLNEICEFLRDFGVKLNRENDDGRVNSIRNEEQILNAIRARFGAEIEIPKIREWYDFAILADGKNFFTNIKVSNLENRAADNLLSKIGMGYALTGEILPQSWSDFNAKLAQNLRGGFDYYFLVVNKNDARDVFWTSLKRLEVLQPNGNNLPFQCDWARNREFSARNELDATKYILEIYLESWNKKIAGYPAEIREILENGEIDFNNTRENSEKNGQNPAQISGESNA